MSPLKQSTLRRPTGGISTLSNVYTLPASVGSNQTVTGRGKPLTHDFCVDAQGNSRLMAGSVMGLNFRFTWSRVLLKVGTGRLSQVPPGTSSSPQTITATHIRTPTTTRWLIDGQCELSKSSWYFNQHLPVYDGGGASTSCDGGTLTDTYNCDERSRWVACIGNYRYYYMTIAQPEPVESNWAIPRGSETGLHTNNPALRSTLLFLPICKLCSPR